MNVFERIRNAREHRRYRYTIWSNRQVVVRHVRLMGAAKALIDMGMTRAETERYLGDALNHGSARVILTDERDVQTGELLIVSEHEAVVAHG